MKNLLWLLLFSLMAFVSYHRPATDPSPKWKALFNGKNLDGWVMKVKGYPLGENVGNTFRVENGIMSIRYDQYKSFDNTFGALYYNKKFTNYRLKVEYRFVGETAPGAPEWGYRDSGVQYHSQSPQSLDKDQSFPVCLEFNLHGGNGKDDRPNGQLCTLGTYVQVDGHRNASFCIEPTVKRTNHGDEWVALEIDVRNGKITHYVNGEEVLRADSPRYDSTNLNAKKLIVGNDNVVKNGYISLQSNSHPIDFRKIEIMEYSSKTLQP